MKERFPVITDQALGQQAAAGPAAAPEPCRGCRAPLVPGQRYCLYCGTRCAGARLEFLDVLEHDARGRGAGALDAAPGAGGAVAGAGGAVAPREPGVNGWLRAHSPVLGLTGLLLGTLLIGLLVGHWATGSGGSSAAAPQVIRVPGSAGGTAAGGGTGTAAAGAADASGSGSGGSGAGGSSKAKASSSKATKAPKDAVSVDRLNQLSGKAKDKAIEQAAKKGQPIATGTGAPPPKDDKPAGGGSDFQTIG
jgi:hypothetical protein